jgi:hypothetical protein
MTPEARPEAELSGEEVAALMHRWCPTCDAPLYEHVPDALGRHLLTAYDDYEFAKKKAAGGE